MENYRNKKQKHILYTTFHIVLQIRRFFFCFAVAWISNLSDLWFDLLSSLLMTDSVCHVIVIKFKIIFFFCLCLVRENINLCNLLLRQLSYHLFLKLWIGLIDYIEMTKGYSKSVLRIKEKKKISERKTILFLANQNLWFLKLGEFLSVSNNCCLYFNIYSSSSLV